MRHRNLVRLGELFGDEDTWFFSMEIVRGLDFLRWVRWSATSPARPPGWSPRSASAT